MISGFKPKGHRTFVTGWLGFNFNNGHAAGCTSIDAETCSKETLYRSIALLINQIGEPEDRSSDAPAGGKLRVFQM
jgi:hypothetical protein